jgi:carbon storage regulator CsrA
MLVLSRKTGQQIVLPEIGISIAVLGVRGNRVRLGFEGPASATVHRAEVWQRILALASPNNCQEIIGEPPLECSTP